MRSPNYPTRVHPTRSRVWFYPARREGVWKQRPVQKVMTVKMKKKMNSFEGFIGRLIDKAC